MWVRYQLRFRNPGRLLAAAGVLAALAAVALPPTALGDGDSNNIVRVEEDWSLTVSSPDPAKSSPQVSTQMIRAPTAPRFCNFHINSCDVPNFTQGGLQLQAWNGSTNITVLNSANRATMSTDNELVTWTQYMRVDNGQTLKFGICNAASSTWGDFSGLEITVTGATANLHDYTADYSQQHSGVTFGANRVSSMVLVATRIYYSNGTVVTDQNPRIIYSAVLDPALGGL